MGVEVNFRLFKFKAGIKICNETTELCVLPQPYQSFCLIEKETGHVVNIPVPNNQIELVKKLLHPFDNTFITVFDYDTNDIITSGILNLTKNSGQLLVELP